MSPGERLKTVIRNARAGSSVDVPGAMTSATSASIDSVSLAPIAIRSGNQDDANLLAGDARHSTRLAQGRHGIGREKPTDQRRQPPRAQRRTLHAGAIG